MQSPPLVNRRGQAVVAPTFNPSTWEEETGNDVAGQREKVISLGRDRSLTAF